MQSKAQEAGLTTFDPELISDLSNILAAPESVEFLGKNELKRQVEAAVAEDLAGTILAGEEYETTFNTMANNQLRHHLNSQEFLKELGGDIASIPGNSPLDKALTLNKILAEAHGSSSSNNEDDEGKPGIGQSGANTGGKEAAQKLSKALRLMDKLQPGEDPGKAPEEQLSQEARLVAMLSDSKLLVMLEVAAKVESYTHLQTSTGVNYVLDKNGAETRRRSIRDIGELGKVRSHDLIMPTRSLALNVLNNETTVNDNYRKENSLPFFSIIIDDSGSMSGHESYVALGILYSICLKVAAKQAVLLFSFFERHCHKFHFFDPLATECPSVLDWFHTEASHHKFDKGGTHVGRAVEELLDEYNRVVTTCSRLNHKQRNVIVVNDGDDDASNLSLKMLKGAKLNAFLVGGGSNSVLRGLCVQSGGLYKEKFSENS
jgi:hypothetical protein